MCGRMSFNTLNSCNSMVFNTNRLSCVLRKKLPDFPEASTLPPENGRAHMDSMYASSVKCAATRMRRNCVARHSINETGLPSIESFTVLSSKMRKWPCLTWHARIMRCKQAPNCSTVGADAAAGNIPQTARFDTTLASSMDGASRKPLAKERGASSGSEASGVPSSLVMSLFFNGFWPTSESSSSAVGVRNSSKNQRINPTRTRQIPK
mmetsp:Transcript_52508/g.152917  ORF Transcript_52508/g.152917 Transcript_52508/m.152917 type:complete len:208 (-) Transcript_52508:86-709(-)